MACNDQTVFNNGSTFPTSTLGGTIRPIANNNAATLIWPEGTPEIVSPMVGQTAVTNDETGFLSSQLGRLVQAECIVDSSIIERTGVLTEVGSNYIVLDMLDNSGRVMCNLDSIQFVSVFNNNVGTGGRNL